MNTLKIELLLIYLSLLPLSLIGQENSKLEDTLISFHQKFFIQQNNDQPFSLADKSIQKVNLKSNQGILCLDSTLFVNWNSESQVWDTIGKEHYNYDFRGNILEEIQKDGNITETKIIYEYDENGIIKRRGEFAWDFDENIWNGEDCLDYSFNLNGDLTQLISCQWDTTLNNWGLGPKREYIYNSENKLVKEISYGWVTTSEGSQYWDADNYIVYSYNETQKLWTDTSYSYYEESDIILSHITNINKYTYDDLGNLTLKITKSIADDLSSYIIEYSDMVQNIYNNENLLIQRIYSIWDDTAEQWIPDTKNDKSYNENGEETEDYKFVYLEGNWELALYDNNIYNVYGDLIKKYMNMWWMETSTKDSLLIEYYYDQNYTFEDLNLPELEIDSDYDESELYSHKLDSATMYSWDIEISSWKPIRKVFNYYSDLTSVDINHQTSSSVSVYPNPASNFIMIKSSLHSSFLFQLYNLNGVLILNSEYNADSAIDIGNIKPGLYLFRFEQNDLIRCGKIIIK